MPDLTPDRLARLRVWAERRTPNGHYTGPHKYDGACPWCRTDSIQPGRIAGFTFDGNAHDLAIELLDEIERLRKIIDGAMSALGDEAPAKPEWLADYLGALICEFGQAHEAVDALVAHALEQSVAAAKDARRTQAADDERSSDGASLPSQHVHQSGGRGALRR